MRLFHDVKPKIKGFTKRQLRKYRRIPKFQNSVDRSKIVKIEFNFPHINVIRPNCSSRLKISNRSGRFRKIRLNGLWTIIAQNFKQKLKTKYLFKPVVRLFRYHTQRSEHFYYSECKIRDRIRVTEPY